MIRWLVVNGLLLAVQIYTVTAELPFGGTTDYKLIEIVDTDESNVTFDEVGPDGGYSAYGFNPDSKVSAPAKSKIPATLPAQFSITSTIKLPSLQTGFLFAVVDETTKAIQLGLEVTPTGLNFYYNNPSGPVASLPVPWVPGEWARVGLAVNDGKVTWYLNCAEAGSAGIADGPLEIGPASQLHLAHSGTDPSAALTVFIDDLVLSESSQAAKDQCNKKGYGPSSEEPITTPSNVDDTNNDDEHSWDGSGEPPPVPPPPPGIQIIKGDKGEKGDQGPPGESKVGPPGPPGPPYNSAEENGVFTELGSGEELMPVEGLPGPPGPPGVCSCNITEVLKSFKAPEPVQGAPGIDGKAGPPGMPGLPGPTGERGMAGPEGSKGDRGDEGPRGPEGIQGPKGDPGIQGIPGSHGNPGPPGPMGRAEYSNMDEVITGSGLEPGRPGSPGPKGASGVDGLPGQSGPRGLPGAKGDRGPAGSKGNKGEKGHSGGQGSRGFKGEPGQSGKDGRPGLSGENGRHGGKGEKGDIGPAGPPGPPAVPQKAPEKPSKEIEGGSSKGEPGSKGEKGGKGDKGDAGASGIAGVPGAIGPAGLQGEKGDHGEDGSSGPVGPEGKKGEKGDTGPPGLAVAGNLKGEPGKRGRRGRTGPAGPVGLPGPKGEIGLPGFKGPQGHPGVPGLTKDCKGEKGDPGVGNVEGNTTSLKGDKGEPGRDGSSGPAGPPGLPSNPGSQYVPIPGPPGPPGPPGVPGISIQGDKGEPGPPGYSFGTENTVPAIPPSLPIGSISVTVTFKNIDEMIWKSPSCTSGTFAFITDDDTLLIRVSAGWKYVVMGNLIPVGVELPPSTDLLSEKTQPPFESSNLIHNQPIHIEGAVLRVAALNEPYTGGMKGHSRVDYSCFQQARRAGLDGTFRAFLSSRVKNMESIVHHSDWDLPVVNTKGEVLFDSWKSIFAGDGGYFPQPPKIYSFNGKHILTDPTWPYKNIWHGSLVSGEKAVELHCDSWDSSSALRQGLASPMAEPLRILGQERVSCAKPLAVLCVEVTRYTSRQRRNPYLSEQDYHRLLSELAREND